MSTNSSQVTADVEQNCEGTVRSILRVLLAKQEGLKPEQKFQLLSSPSHIALNKGEEALKAAINDTIARMVEDGSLNASSQAWLKVDLNPDNLKD